MKCSKNQTIESISQDKVLYFLLFSTQHPRFDYDERGTDPIFVFYYFSSSVNFYICFHPRVSCPRISRPFHNVGPRGPGGSGGPTRRHLSFPIPYGPFLLSPVNFSFLFSQTRSLNFFIRHFNSNEPTNKLNENKS